MRLPAIAPTRDYLPGDRRPITYTLSPDPISTVGPGSPATPTLEPTSSGRTLSKLNLGVALLADPGLLLDETYAGFDRDTCQKFWGLVAQRRDAGRTGLIISHFVVEQDCFHRIG